MSIQYSNVARPLSYKTKTTFSRQNQNCFFIDHQSIKPRPQKTFPYRKIQYNDASYARFAQSGRNYSGNRKKPAYYRLSSQAVLNPKLGS